MTTYVLLTDDNEATVLVACPTPTEAEAVAMAAHGGGTSVSPWLVPGKAVTDHQRVLEILRRGGSCIDINEAELASAPREAAN